MKKGGAKDSILITAEREINAPVAGEFILSSNSHEGHWIKYEREKSLKKKRGDPKDHFEERRERNGVRLKRPSNPEHRPAGPYR